MAIKGRHNRIPPAAALEAGTPANPTVGPSEGRATRRDLFAARAQAGNWVLAYVAPDRIDPNPNQPRRQIERSALEELKQSIRARGILQPLLGAKSGAGRVLLVAGHRRLQAARELGLPRVPVVLVDQLKEEDTVIDAVIENIQRRNLEAWEEGVAYAQLADEFGWTHDEIGRKIGKSRSYVSTRIRAAEKLSPRVKEVLATGNWLVLSGSNPELGTLVPASEEFHNQGVGEKAASEKAAEGDDYLTAAPGSVAPLNNVEVIRRLTTLPAQQQDELLLKIGQRLNAQVKLSVKDIIELIKAERGGEGYQLSFVDLGVEELEVFHQWSHQWQPSAPTESRPLSVEELDRLIEVYEKDLSKLRRVRAEKNGGKNL